VTGRHRRQPARELVTLAVLTAWVLPAYGHRVQEADATIAVNADETFQLIRSWEAVAQVGTDESSSHLEELLDEAVDLGITRLRVSLTPSLESKRDVERELREGLINQREWRCARHSTPNDNDDDEVIDWNGFTFDELNRKIETIVLPLRRRLEDAGERLWVNMHYVAFNNGCTGYEYAHDDPDEYAEFVLAVYLHLKQRYGLVPDSWSVINEPENVRIWTADLLARAMDKSAARLAKAGFTPAFLAPEAKNPRSALKYFEAVWSRRGLRKHLVEMSYHRYSLFKPADIEAIGRMGEERGIDTAMLEKIGAGPDELHEDLTLGRVSSWQQFSLGFPGRDTGGHYLLIDPKAPVGQQVSLSRTARFLRVYFRAIRPGARRLGASSDHPEFKPVAFRNRNGMLAVVVNASRAGRISVQQLEPGTYQVSCWTQISKPGAPDPCETSLHVDETKVLTTSLPAKGVLSVVQQEVSR
jgi:hypothetical protein